MQYSAADVSIDQDRASIPMPKITCIEHDGTVHTVEAEIGSTVMESAMKGGVTGIVAECGGSCTCATCMVYVDAAWLDKTGTRSEEEEDQLDFAFDVKPNSRLSCQIKVTEALDGLIVRTPAYQGR
jgi:ferredoxin, 2Fe-2S